MANAKLHSPWISELIQKQISFSYIKIILSSRVSKNQEFSIIHNNTYVPL